MKNDSGYQAYIQTLNGLAETPGPGWYSAPLEAFGLAGVDEQDGGEPEDLSTVIEGFGYLAPSLGIYEPAEVLAEVAPEFEGFGMTPIMELAPEDYCRTVISGPYLGMVGLGLDGETYQYQQDQLGRGFFKRLRKRFKKLRKRIKRGIRRVIRKVRDVARKVIKRLPGGKYLIKVAQKLKKIALKMVKPLAKLVGKAAPFLAKVAAFVPGYGPAIAAGLHAAGKIANVINRVGAKVSKAGQLIFPKGGAQALQFKKTLAAEAQKLAREKQSARAREQGAGRLRARVIAGLGEFENEIAI